MVRAMEWVDDESDGDGALLDERDLAEWAGDGVAALERYLARHAEFDRWRSDHLRRYGREPGDVAE
jgi:hypothetical protein